MKRFVVAAIVALSVVFLRAEDAPKPDAPKPDAPKASEPAKPAHNIGYQDTPLLAPEPTGTWHVHDGLRPQPRVVRA